MWLERQPWGTLHDSGCFIETSLVYSVYAVDALQ